MNGNILLPYSQQFSLPPVIACPGSCEEENYCSKLCVESNWDLFHSLLSTRESVESAQRDAHVKFIDHVNRTNHIFILVAKVISFTILKYRKLERQQIEKSKSVLEDVLDKSNFSLLLKSWKPISMGFKRKWWDCIVLPGDVAICNEASFRMQIRDAISEVYGHIVGMFELNYLDLVVASLVEDYFKFIDDLGSLYKKLRK